MISKNNQNIPKKINPEFLKKFCPKDRQEERKDQQPIPKINKNKNIFKERFSKALEEKNSKNNEKLKKIKFESNNQNMNKNNLVQNLVNNHNLKQKEIEEKKIQSQKEKDENEIQRQLKIKKISEKQKEQKKKEDEIKRQREAEKKELEEEKKQKEKEWKQQMDKARVFMMKNDSCDLDEAVRRKMRLKAGKIKKISEGQKPKIFMDLTTKSSQYFIYGYEKELIKEYFPNNYICHYFNKIIKRYEWDIMEDDNNYISKSLKTEKTLKFPVNKGEIDISVMELLIELLMEKEIGIESYEQCSILFAEPIKCNKETREKIAQIFFETFNVEKLFMIKPSILNLLSKGKYTGIVGELEEDISNYIPIFDCYSLPHATINSDLCRKTILDYMKTLLVDIKYDLNEDIIKEIVNRTCYVSLDYENELNNVEPYYYELPDDKIIIKEPRIKSPELLFSPELYSLSKSQNSISKNFYNSINKCDNDIKKELYQNIILTGVNSKFKGLENRLKKEIRNLDYKLMDNEVNVTSNEEGIQEGVESFFSNSNFDQLYITREEYDWDGCYIINKKCF